MKVSIEYENPTTATVVLSEAIDSKEKGPTMFDEWRKELKKAHASLRENTPHCHVRLRYVGIQRYTTPPKILFRQEDDL